MTATTSYTEWVCGDCAQHAANGECGGCDGGHGGRVPLSHLEEGAHVSNGLPWEEHHEDCDLRNSMAAREAEEVFNLAERTERFDCNVQCEYAGFRAVTCPGCGALPGDRYAVTVTPHD